jgi:uncharacterized protein involved in exopolysaccharide biosynthesis
MSATEMQEERIEQDDEISLIDLLTTLGQEKKVLFRVTLGATLVALAYSLWVTPVYTAKTVIMLPQQQQTGATAALAQLGALTGAAGLAAAGKSPDETYLALLKSVSLHDDLITHFKLKERYSAKTMTDTRKALENVTTLTSDKKTGLLTVEVDDPSPEMAAALANGYVSTLHVLLGRLAVTEAQQRRLFFEQQITKTTQDLAKAEDSFRQTREKGGMQVTDVLAEVSIKSSAELRGKIAASEVELNAIRQFATTENPEVQRISSTLSALRAQLAQVEKGSAEGKALNETGQEAVRTFREFKTRQAILETMIKQYEIAKVDEAREGPAIQQVDIAQPPERKSKPKRSLILLIGAVAGLLLGIMAAFVRSAMRRAASDPFSASRIAQMKSAWSFRSPR